MSLTKQIHCWSVATDAFYEKDEVEVHMQLLEMYKARKELTDKEEIKDINKKISEKKEILVGMLNERLSDSTPRALRTDILNDKNVISLFESCLTRTIGLKTNEFTDELVVLNVFFFQILENLIKNGFVYNGQKYVFLTASAGQIRTKRAVFIKEATYERIKSKLMCGLTFEDINNAGGINPNKFLSYLALNSSATDVWEDFDIDKAIVVDDFETDVFGEVDFIEQGTYKIERKKTYSTVPHMDGCGIMRSGTTRMCRGPWLKGLLVQFPFDKFIKEKCPSGDCTVKDIYGKEYNIIKDDIRYILTKSQFKLWRYYSSWDSYKENFKKYNCEISYCNLEEQDIPYSRINYQMLQTLVDMTDKEISKITKTTIDEIQKIGNDYKTTMKLLGATSTNINPSWFQEALMIYPELIRDPYCRDVLKQTKKSLVKQARSGRLRVNGKYMFMSPDLYAFCEWLFLGEKNPKGLLANGEVYTKEFSDKSELACLRSPHLFKEWAIRNNNRNEETEKWFGMTKCLYTSSHDLITRLLMNDNDGDKALVVKDRTLTSIAKRNMKDIVPLAYELKKAKGGFLNTQSIYDGISCAYTGGNIGPISNKISKVWNNGNVSEEQVDVVKWLTYENNQVIDYSKTLWRDDPPKEVEKLIKENTKGKVPNFFIYAKDKLDSQVEPANNSTVNRISKSIPDCRIKFCKTVGKFDYFRLMSSNCPFSISPESKIVQSYDYWNMHQYLFNTKDETHSSQEDLYMFQKIRQYIINETDASLDEIVNTLVAYLYTVRIGSAKKMLWACFGDVMLKNLKENTQGLGKICPHCGKRFKPKKNASKYCSDDCATEAEKIKKKFRQS